MEALVLASLLQTTVAMAVPLLFAALGELLVERAGVVNIGLEGMILMGAFASMLVAYTTGQPWLGVLAAAVAGATMGALLAVAMVGFGANQVVCGTALNLLALGASGVGYRGVFGVTGSALMVEGLHPVAVPWLEQVPVFGPAVFTQPLLGHLAFVLVPAVSWWLYRTLPGLRWRMAGEDPFAAAAQGVRVGKIRAAALIACGVLAGVAGSYLVLAYAKTFVEGMSAGRGFIALAIVIFGGWSPWGILGAASLFGFAIALQFHIQALGWAVPYQAALVLPYVLTLVVLAAHAGKNRAPAALGKETERS
ncbi:MAG: ABC transporter permease [Candidatus Binatia bacterium]|nr:MAG: ABC transporter permease [Candidatus Binatia bacterium]